MGFYQLLFRGKDETWRPSLDGVQFDALSEADRQMLERPFSEEEVFRTLQKMSGDKESGPDGFTMLFFQLCWEVVKTDVLALFAQFYQSGQFERSLNATFVALIPKKGGAEDIKDF